MCCSSGAEADGCSPRRGEWAPPLPREELLSVFLAPPRLLAAASCWLEATLFVRKRNVVRQWSAVTCQCVRHDSPS